MKTKNLLMLIVALAFSNFLFSQAIFNACPTPLDVYVDNVSIQSATAFWQPEGNADMWVLEVGTPGFEPGMGQGLRHFNYIPNPGYLPNQCALKLFGLEPGTKYELFIRANCKRNESSWVGPYGFRTAAEL